MYIDGIASNDPLSHTIQVYSDVSARESSFCVAMTIHKLEIRVSNRMGYEGRSVTGAMGYG